MYRANDFDYAPGAIPPSTWQYVYSNPMATRYDDYFSGLRLFEFDTLLLDEFLPAPARVLDLGCGTGRHLLHLAARGFSITGLDLSPHMLAVARKKLRAAGLSAELVEEDLRDLSDFKRGSFDAVLCMFSTLGLIRGRAHRVEALRGIRTVVKPGGVFIMHVHNRWFNLFDRDGWAWFLKTHFVMPFQGYEVGDKIMESHPIIPHMYLHIFSVGEVRRALRQAGFKVQEVVYLNRSRDGRLKGSFFRGLRANGFVVVAKV